MLYLEKSFVIPVGVDALQLMCYTVVLSGPQSVHARQH